MQGADVGAAVEVGDGAGNAKHFVVRPGRKAHLGHRILQQVLALVVQRAKLPGLAVRHVGVVTRRAAVESGRLGRAGCGHLGAQVAAWCARRSAR